MRIKPGQYIILPTPKCRVFLDSIEVKAPVYCADSNTVAPFFAVLDGHPVINPADTMTGRRVDLIPSDFPVESN